MSINPVAIQEAYKRIKPYLHETPILTSSILNEWLGAELYFKAESFQKTGSFKVRGVLNCILKLKEIGKMPEHIIAYSSGNHGQACSYVANLFGIKSTIFLPKFTSQIKQQAAEYYGSKIVYTDTRIEAEEKAYEEEKKGKYLIKPFDNNYVIEGQGTACYESLVHLKNNNITPDAIFATCGGGGWISGSYLAKELLSKKSKMFGAEPKNANDAYISIKNGKIFRFHDSPETIADGARTLSISEKTFSYLKKIDKLYEVKEQDITYWTQWLSHLLKVSVEPTSAVSMGAAITYLRENKGNKQKLLILLSGGNISNEKYKSIWKNNLLLQRPKI